MRGRRGRAGAQKQVCTRGASVARRLEGGHVDQVGQVSAAETRGALSDHLCAPGEGWRASGSCSMGIGCVPARAGWAVPQHLITPLSRMDLAPYTAIHIALP